METEVLNSFKKNWHKARNDGWRINNDMFLPPKDHEASKNNWAAVFYVTDYGIAIPNYFIRFYK
jgi:hypothetical protein